MHSPHRAFICPSLMASMTRSAAAWISGYPARACALFRRAPSHFIVSQRQNRPEAVLSEFVLLVSGQSPQPDRHITFIGGTDFPGKSRDPTCISPYSTGNVLPLAKPYYPATSTCSACRYRSASRTLRLRQHLRHTAQNHRRPGHATCRIPPPLLASLPGSTSNG